MCSWFSLTAYRSFDLVSSSNRKNCQKIVSVCALYGFSERLLRKVKYLQLDHIAAVCDMMYAQLGIMQSTSGSYAGSKSCHQPSPCTCNTVSTIIQYQFVFFQHPLMKSHGDGHMTSHLLRPSGWVASSKPRRRHVLTSWSTITSVRRPTSV